MLDAAYAASPGVFCTTGRAPGTANCLGGIDKPDDKPLAQSTLTMTHSILCEVTRALVADTTAAQSAA